jgi:hypothetical protein
MSEKPENPPAFPARGGVYIDQNGMTLRDYFAAAALQGLLARGAKKVTMNGTEMVIDEASFAIADAMLEERAKQDA